MNRKRLVLAALLGLLVLSLVYAFWATPRQEQAPPRATGPRVAAKPKAVGKAAQPAADRLHLGLLAQAPQPFVGASRDIFRFRGAVTPPVEAPAVVAPPMAPPPPPPPPTPEEILREKVARFTFLGFLDKAGVRTVFLSSGGELYLVKAGESFGKAKELLAQEINVKELVIRAAGGPETVRVQLVESEALKPTLLGPSAAGSGTAARGVPAAIRPGGGNIPPRRSILPQREVPKPSQPVVEEAEIEVEQDVQPPDDGVKQEELLKQGLPGGDGNVHKQ